MPIYFTDSGNPYICGDHIETHIETHMHVYTHVHIHTDADAHADIDIYSQTQDQNYMKSEVEKLLF